MSIDNDSWDSVPVENDAPKAESDSWDDSPNSAPKAEKEEAEPEITKGIKDVESEAPVEESPEDEPKEPKAEKPAKKEPAPQPEETVLKVGDKVLSKAEIERLVEQAQTIEQKAAEVYHRDQQARQLLEMLQNNPEHFFNQPQFAAKKKQLIEAAIRQEIENELLTPDQRRIKELEAQQAEFKRRQEEEAKAQEQRSFEEKRLQRQQEFGEMFKKAMESTVLSTAPEIAGDIISEMATLYRHARQNGYNPTPAQLAQEVEGKYYKTFHTLANRLSGEQLIKFLGDKVVKEIRDYDIKALKQSKASVPAPTQTPAWKDEDSSRPKGSKEYLDPYTAREIARKRLGL